MTKDEATARARVNHILAVVHAERNARTQPTADKAEYGADEPRESSGLIADIRHDLTMAVGADGLKRHVAHGSRQSNGRSHHEHRILLTLLPGIWLGCNRLRRIRLLRIGGLCWVRRLRLRRRVLARIITCSFRVRRRR